MFVVFVFCAGPAATVGWQELGHDLHEEVNQDQVRKFTYREACDSWT
jgi:hypothetical protein